MGKLSINQEKKLVGILKERFENNMSRHKGIKWESVKEKLSENSEKLWSLNEMERTGGEPDVVFYDKKSDEFIFYDCSLESPKGRRSLCYDDKALKERKEHKPKGSSIGMASLMGIEILSEKEYRKLQKLGEFDLKTSSWVKTPEDVRKKGGAVFCDRRYGQVFLYHNGADSYYAARGFRGSVRI